jgi:hypothetical protein
MVKLDGRNELGEPFRSALRDPKNLDRWYAALKTTSQDIQAQITVRAAELLALQQECLDEGQAGKRRYFAAVAEHNEWRARAVYAKAKNDERLVEVKRLRALAAEASQESRHQRYRDTRGLVSALKQIAHYPIEADPQECGSPEAMVEFFQYVAQTALDKAGTEDE